MKIEKIRAKLHPIIILKTVQLYGTKNKNKYGLHSPNYYPNQIQVVWNLAYRELARQHPKMKWLQKLVKTSSSKIKVKTLLILSGTEEIINLPGADNKLGAIVHAGGSELLQELEQIIINLGNIPLQPQDNYYDTRY